MQLVTDEKRIDKGAEFNQLQEHDHRPGNACWCGFGVGSPAKTLNDAYDRPYAGIGAPQGKIGKPISPAILEFRNKQLEGKIANLENIISNHANFVDRYKNLEAENAELKRRIAGFEQMTATLSKKIDEMFSEFQRLTGSTPQETSAAKTCGEANLLGNTLHGCILPDDHGGPCRTAEPLKAA